MSTSFQMTFSARTAFMTAGFSFLTVPPLLPNMFSRLVQGTTDSLLVA